MFKNVREERCDPKGFLAMVRTAARDEGSGRATLGIWSVVLALLMGCGGAHGLDWKPVPGAPTHQMAALTPTTAGKPLGFTTLAPTQTGVLFTNRLPTDRSLTNHILMNGSGVALGDIDGDGWVDIFLCGLGGGSALYKNLGLWTFTNVTSSAGISLAGVDATGAVFADVDGDGDLDLLVGGIGTGVRYFENDGAGHFVDRTRAAGLTSQSGTMSLALADYDGDGDLDLYVANYRTSTVRDGFQMQLRVSEVEGRKTVTLVNGRSTQEPDLIGRFSIQEDGALVENGEADVLYRNEGGDISRQ